MKKTILLLALVAFVVSCGTPKTVIGARKVIKGYWSLDNISYSESGTYNVKLFSDTSKECFEGSTWRFIPNNNSGLYTINSTDCPTGDRNFIFSIQEIDANTGLYDFLLKPTTKLGKPDKDNSVGFRVSLAQLNESSMKWEQTVSVDGKPFTINMNFSKISE
ncbi:lipocalin family protein [Patiriisocius hiemis]|uniref:Lipocalin family protein n=1 Tax=Patiriisocius hiemis TaxID=3075604 RepID=A0ABU2YAK3_9FLAO|nr:lipocalin family protein [Constantimarinum sp. W242]MDT0554820.1 lipocalin family protein [Constantimarinum sp. W242]